MRDLLQGLAAGDRTVLVCSHPLSEMQALADDVVILAAGRLVQQGSLTDVLRGVGPERVRDGRGLDAMRAGMTGSRCAPPKRTSSQPPCRGWAPQSRSTARTPCRCPARR